MRELGTNLGTLGPRHLTPQPAPAVTVAGPGAGSSAKDSGDKDVPTSQEGGQLRPSYGLLLQPVLR